MTAVAHFTPACAEVKYTCSQLNPGLRGGGRIETVVCGMKLIIVTADLVVDYNANLFSKNVFYSILNYRCYKKITLQCRTFDPLVFLSGSCLYVSISISPITLSYFAFSILYAFLTIFYLIFSFVISPSLRLSHHSFLLPFPMPLYI
jgi:hypothetical protein